MVFQIGLDCVVICIKARINLRVGGDKMENNQSKRKKHRDSLYLKVIIGACVGAPIGLIAYVNNWLG